MNKFLKNIGLFGMIIIFISLGLDFFLTSHLKERNSEGEIIVWKDLYGGNLTDFNNFIYGSSRAWVHIDPFILEKKLGVPYYNLGANGQNFTVQKFRHDELEQRTEIKSIIYSVDIFTLSSSDYIYDYYQFLPFMLWKDNGIRDFLYPYGYYNQLDFYLPLARYYGHRKLMSKIFFKEDLNFPARIRGYKGREKLWNNDLQKALKNEETINIIIDDNLLKEFEIFIGECQKNNIDLVLVYSPEYIEGQNFVENRNEILEIYKNLSSKHSYPFFDFSTDSLNYSKEYFYNAGHLNKTGAEMFTNQLADSLKVLRPVY